MRDEFLSEEDLDLRNLTWDELIAYWNLWLEQAQATNDLDEAFYSHGVFDRDPAVVERQLAGRVNRSPEASFHERWDLDGHPSMQPGCGFA
jgi:hypothetical protein